MSQDTKLNRKSALSMEELVQMYIRSMKISSGLNCRRVFAAWDNASGAGAYTIKRFFRGGKLYVTINSSVVRSQLYFQKDVILDKINALLRQDPLFTSDAPGASYVTELILK